MNKILLLAFILDLLVILSLAYFGIELNFLSSIALGVVTYYLSDFILKEKER